MDIDNEQNYILNLKLMKITGFYQIMSPDALTFYGYNVYKVIAGIEVAVGVCTTAVLFLSVYYLDEINEITNHLMLIAALFFATLKIFWVSRNTEIIWNTLDMASINFLSYKGHKKELLKTARARSIPLSIFFVILWSSVFFAWSLSPFFLDGIYLEVEFDGEMRRFRYNLFNYVYPVSEQFYNEHFSYFYGIELIQIIFWAHGTIAYDTFVISICISIVFQLKTIAVSYASLNERKGKLYSN